MAYIPLHQSLFTHWKTDALADSLGLNVTYAGGHLCRLWTWAIDNAPDGDLSDLPPRAIARGADYSGDPALFLQALIDARLVDEGPLRIHDWAEYALGLMEAEERAKKLHAERQKRYRERQNHKGDAKSVTRDAPRDQNVTPGIVTKQGPSVTSDARVTVRDGNNLEEHRGEERNTSKNPLSGGTSSEEVGAACAASATTDEPPGSQDATEKPPGPSAQAIEVLEYQRRKFARAKRGRPNPVQLRLLEQAIEELGVQALCESIEYMAGQGVAELSKALRAAYTYRHKQENGSSNGGTTTGRMGQNGNDSGHANGNGHRAIRAGGRGALAASDFAYYNRPYEPSSGAGSGEGPEASPSRGDKAATG